MYTINGSLFLEMLKSGANNLTNHKKEIDALNVFPVPDGDTGTNMSMTFQSGVADAKKVADTDDIGAVSKGLSKGLLMGARGNSGVITSQIFRGFYKSVEDKKVINVNDLAEAFENGSRVAYKAIMKPVEGTILTVIREASWYAKHTLEETPEMTIEEYFAKLIDYANESLAHTPDLLPVLKEVGVVDSGGTGLVRILEGMNAALNGKAIEAREVSDEVSHSAASDVSNDEFGYCTEYIIRLNKEHLNINIDRIKNKLASIGDSLVVVKDDDLVKVHVHTLRPGDALNFAQRYGEFIKLKIENMQEQHTELMASATAEKAEHKKYGIITVASGEGLTRIFKDLRADVVINGGQTMNPSTESFLEHIDKLDADHILILPNNSNIVLAASQAADLREDLDIHVIKSTSIQEGVAALTLFDPEGDINDNIAEMEEEIENIHSGSITYAIKDTVMNGVTVKEGDYIAMFKKEIVASTTDKIAAIKALIEKMVSSCDAEIITIIAGEDSNDKELKAITKYVEENYDIEMDIVKGDQPVYSYLVGVE